MPLSIRVALAQQNSFELHCGRDSCPLDWKEVESLATTAGREYFGDDQSPNANWAPKFPQLTGLGRSLYQ